MKKTPAIGDTLAASRRGTALESEESRPMQISLFILSSSSAFPVFRYAARPF